MARPHGQLYPCLQYDDAPAAIDFLSRAFGFVPGDVYLDPDGRVTHAEVMLGAACLMVYSRAPGVAGFPPADDPARLAFSLYLGVDEIEAHYQQAVSAGAVIIRDLGEGGGGGRGYSAADPEGLVWSFGEYQAPEVAEHRVHREGDPA